MAERVPKVLILGHSFVKRLQSDLEKKFDHWVSTTFDLYKILYFAADLSLFRYELCLFRAMCSLAFYAFLRVGEMVVTNNNSSHLSIDNVAKLVNAANHVVSIRVTFRNYKHSYNQAPCSLFIQRQPSFCPVQILLDYLKLRGHSPGPLFTIRGLPVTRQYFCGLLTTVIKRCGLNPVRYKGHSFRIGAASHAAERGMSDAQIRVLGRWKSNAFLRYIRIPSISSTN